MAIRSETCSSSWLPQQQRVAIARALANDPPILIGDEVTGELDPETGFEVMEVIAGLNRERGTTEVILGLKYQLTSSGFLGYTGTQ